MRRLVLTGIGQLVTMAGFSGRPVRGMPAGETLGIIEDAWVVIEDGVIAGIGSGSPPSGRGRYMDVGGRAVVPGLIDSHTHALFAGWRADEFEQRLRGAGYLDILKAGGGILSTVSATREVSPGELVQIGLRRLDAFARMGTTTVEIKSGYGLSREAELTMLRALDRIDSAHPVDVVPTFMGAHAIPEEHKSNPDAYVDQVISMLEEVGEKKLARFVDVFCEDGAFTPDQSRRILERARDMGLEGRLHADEMGGGAGAQLAVDMGARSADHLVHVTDEGIRALAGSDTMATLLPGTSFFLRLNTHAPGRQLWDAGAAVALASDFNPGSCPIQDLKLVMSLACLNMGLLPAEALVATTINAAHSLGVADTVGSVEVGKRGDLVILDADDWRHLVYRPGSGLVWVTVKGCRVLPGERGDFRQGT